MRQCIHSFPRGWSRAMARGALVLLGILVPAMVGTGITSPIGARASTIPGTVSYTSASNTCDKTGYTVPDNV
jgi:hypothetical protein